MRMVIILLGLFINISLAYEAPYSSSNFQNVLDVSYLQEYGDDEDITTKLPDLETYSSYNFHLADSEYMQFMMNGEGNRCELRQMDDEETESSWAVSDSNTMEGSLSIPEQDSGVAEVTFMQVHCENEPLLRISWMESKLLDGVTYDDSVMAHVKTSDDMVEKYYLGDRHVSFKTYTVNVSHSMLYVYVDDELIVSGVDVSYWEDNTCNFKAGAYVNDVSDDDADGVISFSSLSW